MADEIPGEAAPEASLELESLSPETALGALMDLMVPEEDSEETPEGGSPVPAPAPGDGSPAAPVEGTPAAPAAAPSPGAGAPGSDGVANEAPSTGLSGVDATSLEPKWVEVLSGLETKQKEQYEAEAVSEVQQEHSKYFEALGAHPRTLVGKEVPSGSGDGTEILKDAADAREWQEQIRHQLIREVGDRVSRKSDDTRGMMETLHSSVGLFQNNPDLIPGTKQFDKELTNNVAALLKPYELRVEEKLVGYTIPVQGLVTQARQQLNAVRSAAAPAGAPAAATPHRSAEQPRTVTGQFAGDAPQAGIPSAAGKSGEEGENFDTLWGTLGIRF